MSEDVLLDEWNSVVVATEDTTDKDADKDANTTNTSNLKLHILRRNLKQGLES